MLRLGKKPDPTRLASYYDAERSSPYSPVGRQAPSTVPTQPRQGRRILGFENKISTATRAFHRLSPRRYRKMVVRKEQPL